MNFPVLRSSYCFQPFSTFYSFELHRTLVQFIYIIKGLVKHLAASDEKFKVDSAGIENPFGLDKLRSCIHARQLRIPQLEAIRPSISSCSPDHMKSIIHRDMFLQVYRSQTMYYLLRHMIPHDPVISLNY
eukprot:sb/3475153/